MIKEMKQDPEKRQDWTKRMTIALMRYQTTYTQYELLQECGMIFDDYEIVLADMLKTRLIPEIQSMVGANSRPALEMEVLRVAVLAPCDFEYLNGEPEEAEERIAELDDLFSRAKKFLPFNDRVMFKLRHMLRFMLDEGENEDPAVQAKIDDLLELVRADGEDSDPEEAELTLEELRDEALETTECSGHWDGPKAQFLDRVFNKRLDGSKLLPLPKIMEMGQSVLESMRLLFGQDHVQVLHFTGVLTWFAYHGKDVEVTAQLVLAKLECDFRAMEFEDLVDPFQFPLVTLMKVDVDPWEKGVYIGLECLLHKLHQGGHTATAKKVYEHAVQTTATSTWLSSDFVNTKRRYQGTWVSSRKFQARHAMDLGDVVAAEKVCRSILSDVVACAQAENTLLPSQDDIADIRGSLASVLIHNPQKVAEAQTIYDELMLNAEWLKRNVDGKEDDGFRWNTDMVYFFPHHLFERSRSVDEPAL